MLVSLLPSDVGEAILGDTWSAAKPILIPLGTALAGTAAVNGLTVGMRSLGAAQRSLFTSAIVSSVLVVGGVVGVAADGAVGAAYGMIGPAAAGAALGVDRHARGAQRLDVAVDRALGDLQLLGQLAGGQLPPRLQQEEQ